MLELTDAEQRALQVVTLRTRAEKEAYGGPHHFNWKMVGLSTARYRSQAMDEEHMPTERCKAAFASACQFDTLPFSALSSAQESLVRWFNLQNLANTAWVFARAS